MRASPHMGRGWESPFVYAGTRATPLSRLVACFFLRGPRGVGICAAKWKLTTGNGIAWPVTIVVIRKTKLYCPGFYLRGAHVRTLGAFRHLDTSSTTTRRLLHVLRIFPSVSCTSLRSTLSCCEPDDGYSSCTCCLVGRVVTS